MSRKLLAVGAVAAIGVACAFLLTSPLLATPGGKKPIMIDSFATGTEGGEGTFYLSLGTAGDLGKLTFTRSNDAYATGRSPDMTPEGLTYSRSTETDVFRGRKGTLVIRAKAQGYDLGFFPQVNNSLGQVNPVVGTTWSIVRGTGVYAGLRGGGKWVAVGFRDNKVVARYAGFVETH
jgi:hypothetical protein